MTGRDASWAIRLFRRSVIKQEKFRRIVSFLGPTDRLACLDIGGDNGVVSLLLRRRGGSWWSADLDARSVEAIRSLVGTDVHAIDGVRTPFADAFFDRVVVVDFLEHIATDREFALELARILKPGGILLVNVPHHRPGSWIVHLRNAVGLTDEWHGHLRPGYTLEDLERLFAGSFVLERRRTYSKEFSELIDILLNAARESRRRGRASGRRSVKGAIVTEEEFAARGKEMHLLGILHPFLWLFTRLDALLFFRSGHRLIARYRRVDTGAAS